MSPADETVDAAPEQQVTASAEGEAEAEAAAEAEAPADIEVLSGNPDEEEMAAITAVLAGALEELAEEQGRREQAATSAWARSQRTLRAPLYPGTGIWRSFSG